MGRQDGFTLIELFVVFAIIVLVAAYSGPSIIKYRENAKLSAAIRDLRNNIAAAKTQAARNGATISVVFLDHGYRIFLDANGDGDVSAGERVLLTASYPAGIFVKGNAFPLQNSAHEPYTAFDSRGMLIKGSHGNITLGNRDGKERVLSIGLIGMIELS